MPLSIGTRLGSYEILAPIDAGGMGEVYKTRDTKLERDVAIKVLPKATGDCANGYDREAAARRRWRLGVDGGKTDFPGEPAHGQTVR